MNSATVVLTKANFFTTSSDVVRPILEEMNDENLIYLYEKLTGKKTKKIKDRDGFIRGFWALRTAHRRDEEANANFTDPTTPSDNSPVDPDDLEQMKQLLVDAAQFGRPSKVQSKLNHTTSLQFSVRGLTEKIFFANYDDAQEFQNYIMGLDGVADVKLENLTTVTPTVKPAKAKKSDDGNNRQATTRQSAGLTGIIHLTEKTPSYIGKRGAVFAEIVDGMTVGDFKPKAEELGGDLSFLRFFVKDGTATITEPKAQ